MIKISQSNSKMGKIHSFSTLPGDANHLLKLSTSTEPLTTVHGTCGGVCQGCFKVCYAVKFAKLYNKTVIPALVTNTKALRDGSAFIDVDEYIDRRNKNYYQSGDPSKLSVKIFRWNTSGEIENVDQLVQMNRIAAAHPETKFGIYSKNYRAVDEFFTKYGETADNFAINISEWKGSAKEFITKWRGQRQFNVFLYDDGNRPSDGKLTTIMEHFFNTQYAHCPSVDSKGHHTTFPSSGKRITCDICGKCYTKHNTITAVYSH